MRAALLFSILVMSLVGCDGNHCFDCETNNRSDFCEGAECFRCGLTGCGPIECRADEACPEGGWCADDGYCRYPDVPFERCPMGCGVGQHGQGGLAAFTWRGKQRIQLG